MRVLNFIGVMKNDYQLLLFNFAILTRKGKTLPIFDFGCNFGDEFNARSILILFFLLRFMDVMSSIIGARKTEQSVLSGRMYSTEEALTIGLVDEFTKDASEAESKVNSYLQNINKASGSYFFFSLSRNLHSKNMLQFCE